MSEEIVSEIEEDLQKERIKKFWKLYGVYISSFIILIIAIIGGWQLFNYWENKKINDASNNFLEILSLSDENISAAIKKIDEVNDQPYGYHLLLKFKKASLLNKTNQKSEAQLIWRDIYNDVSADEDYRDMALLLSLMNNNDQKDLFDRLDNIIMENRYFSNISKEIKASIYFNNGKVLESKKLFNDILKSSELGQRSQERISNILKTFEDN